MLYSRIYNEALTAEMKMAFRTKNVQELIDIRNGLMQDLEKDPLNSAKLQVVLALIDSINTGGMATALITDFINV